MVKECESCIVISQTCTDNYRDVGLILESIRISKWLCLIEQNVRDCMCAYYAFHVLYNNPLMFFCTETIIYDFVNSLHRKGLISYRCTNELGVKWKYDWQSRLAKHGDPLDTVKCSDPPPTWTPNCKCMLNVQHALDMVYIFD